MFLFVKDYFNKIICEHELILHKKTISYPFSEELGGGVLHYTYLCEKCGYVRKVKLK